MNILVCIKQVPDDSVEIHLNGEGAPDLANVTPVVNAFDTYALEMAARLKESSEGEVTVVCVGEDGAKNSLKNCLAVGADYAYLIKDDAFTGSDSRGISNILKNAAAKIEAETGKKFDLVFCGKEATDAALGQAGPMLAEELGVGVITNITEIALDGDKVTAKQETEEGYRTVETSAPCVVTVTKPEYDPRYPTIKNKMAARKKPIGDLAMGDLADVAADKVGEANAQVKTLKLYEPAKKEAGVKIQEETEEDSALKAVAMMADAKVF
ncbi:electron transfer flavoprotein subunit beta/FixA family protein [Anaerostipes sp. MSJ-23]|uniref:electron transfer flavoprotein subunit beta/FixA family protein n=1 Tax=Anaerostipes sp. MSJ-23 TaxID=2841520 RepID=UPI001C124D96|nr:electron transfer flavoprotein subunit beta/FixA family protein [Anaerostipes sp. MSJ-23]MBU5460798.1 electron transfer flavoprotein subunit beta/FixA family protein [Anaerostipes sp. MSJ-23]